MACEVGSPAYACSPLVGWLLEAFVVSVSSGAHGDRLLVSCSRVGLGHKLLLIELGRWLVRRYSLHGILEPPRYKRLSGYE
jgi:hypothetical protein